MDEENFSTISESGKSNKRELIYAISLEKIKNTENQDTSLYHSRLISDMKKSLPNEYYNKVKELIDGFKLGTVHAKRIYCGSKKSFAELRDDQVRIIIKHIKENIYSVQGVFCKKADNDETQYNNITNRTVPQIDKDENLRIYLGLAEKTEAELAKLVREKGRKASR